jgi:hypothetical protein
LEKAQTLTVGAVRNAFHPQLKNLNKQDKRKLAGAIKNFLEDHEKHPHILAEHTSLDHRSAVIDHHRFYLAQLEEYLINSGLGRFVPLPKWDADDEIPEEFKVVVDGYPPLSNTNP